MILQLNEFLLLGLGLGELYFRSTLGNLTQRPSDKAESQHEPLVKIEKAQKAAKLCESGRGLQTPNHLDLSRIHMHTFLIYDVTRMLGLTHAKGVFLQVGT